METCTQLSVGKGTETFCWINSRYVCLLFPFLLPVSSKAIRLQCWSIEDSYLAKLFIWRPLWKLHQTKKKTFPLPICPLVWPCIRYCFSFVKPCVFWWPTNACLLVGFQQNSFFVPLSVVGLIHAHISVSISLLFFLLSCTALHRSQAHSSLNLIAWLCSYYSILFFLLISITFVSLPYCSLILLG